VKVRAAAVQPLSHQGLDEYSNIEKALGYVEEAARNGAGYVIFPEGYPGPYTGPMDSDGKLAQHPIEYLREAAKAKSVYISAGHLVENPAMAGTYFLAHKLIGPDGKVLAEYHRQQPNHPVFNAYLMGGRFHVLPGNRFELVETDFGKVGLLVCSELFVPELSRIYMLMGADILVAPGGGVHSATRTRLTDTWRCVARSRAAENLCYVIANQNLFSQDQRGRTCLASPESMLAEVDQGEGIAYADLDVARLDQLRSFYYDEEILSPPDSLEQLFHCRPGQCHDRRPELYGKLVEPQADAFRYNYHLDGLETFRAEYERARRDPRVGTGERK
jgi:predicted amidohydrolase